MLCCVVLCEAKLLPSTMCVPPLREPRPWPDRHLLAMNLLFGSYAKKHNTTHASVNCCVRDADTLCTAPMSHSHRAETHPALPEKAERKFEF